MDALEELLGRYAEGVSYPDWEPDGIVALLQTRSSLADREGELSEEQADRLSEADDALLREAPLFHDRLSPLGGPAEVRRRNGSPPPLHWWWHLERLVQGGPGTIP
jgi:hypothetical protein